MKFDGKLLARVVVALVFAAAGAAGAESASDEVNPVLARLGNGETITEVDLGGYLQRRIDLRPASRNVWGVQMAMREMAMTRVLSLEGDSIGVPRIAGRAPERFDDAYSLVVYRKIAPSCEPPVDAAAARKFFDETPQAFRIPAMARLNRIMLPTGASVDGEPAVGWLLQQAQVIGSGSQKFVEVAERATGVYKLDPQGDLGWVTLTDDTQILRALADVKAGDMVGPIREGEFVYLFQVVSKRDARQMTWDEAAATASRRAVGYCREQANAKVEAQLFKKYDVQIDQAKIRSLFTAGRKKPQGVTQ